MVHEWMEGDGGHVDGWGWLTCGWMGMVDMWMDGDG